MGYNTGILNERLTLLHPSKTEGATGRRVTWTEGRTIWTNATWAKGTRALRNGEVTAYDSVMFRVRWADDIEKHCRLKWDGKYYVITSMQSSHRDNTIQIVANEVAPFEYTPKS